MTGSTMIVCHTRLYAHEERLGNIFRELGSHPGLNRGPLTLAVSTLPPELWPLGDSQPSQFSISLRMCHQNPARDRPVTPLHQGRSHTEWNILYIHSSAREAGSPSREPPNTTCKLCYMWGKAWEYFLRTVKNWQPPRIEPGPLTLAANALPPELWPLGDCQPSQFSISLRMYRQKPARDRLVTPLHQGRSHTEWYIHSSAREAGSPSREPPNTTCKLGYTWGKAWEYF